MIGVVVWSNDERQKAVIWCEDQGALAYLHRQENLQEGATWPQVGDLVKLDVETDASDLRHARNVSVVNRQYCIDLPDMLLDASGDSPRIRLVTSDGKRIDQCCKLGDGNREAVLRKRVAGLGN